MTVRAETWRSLGYDEVRVRPGLPCRYHCKEVMSKHLKENKFWCKVDLSSVFPLPYFSFEDQSLWLGTSYLIGSPWGNQGHSVVQPGASPACGPYLQVIPHLLFLLIKIYLSCVPIYQRAFHCKVKLHETVTWSSLLIGFCDLRWRGYLKWNRESHVSGEEEDVWWWSL